MTNGAIGTIATAAESPVGSLEKGSLYSMFVRMLLHNAMEEQKRQEALDMDDEDDDE